MLELFKLLTVNAVFPHSLTSISIIICVQSNNFRIHMNKVTAKMFSLFDTGGEPENASEDVVIMEFKVRDPEEEATLEATAAEALLQIERKMYGAALEAKGIVPGRIRKYGFAFEGKTILIG